MQGTPVLARKTASQMERQWAQRPAPSTVPTSCLETRTALWTNNEGDSRRSAGTQSCLEEHDIDVSIRSQAERRGQYAALVAPTRHGEGRERVHQRLQGVHLGDVNGRRCQRRHGEQPIHFLGSDVA
eukprot:scaffold7052_cov254-Pinguiococcus_pyrenoidosus.AAC.98